MFHDAQCVSCHRFNAKGESVGPDLTNVSQRFQKKEILESIVYPNQVVSDQYASQIVTAGGKTYTGIVAKNADGSLTVLQSDARKVQLKADEVEDIQPCKVSAMPEGLANRLSLEQIGDLFAYLMKAPEPSIAGRGARQRAVRPVGGCGIADAGGGKGIFSQVIPAQVGILQPHQLDSRLRGNDGCADNGQPMLSPLVLRRKRSLDRYKLPI